jgi:hypothetical protein
MESVELAVDEVEVEIENDVQRVVYKIRRVVNTKTKAPRDHCHVVEEDEEEQEIPEKPFKRSWIEEMFRVRDSRVQFSSRREVTSWGVRIIF